ncbi:hypothetical protein A5819_002658 [Enterococcus sp. 7E2_DIV0204]|uniref:Uncharacterized protein n=1 Tax=Candidatus Enterococcus lemimoniae TaxID=1834167 RepID=A0ABZ2T2X5_9ENTE|nr:hypothetical protein A5819_002658 [Enterococcus sp. 7E2_DIV0204]OTO69016.1 hypothetical protein A5866_001215 [Enterococcus sp. 12C11_DIV0727]OTP52615.1 hypothetical protein A5884_001817 [Enterococcus sp. 7D2_DIV0200]
MKLLSKFKLSIHFTVFLTTICSLKSVLSGIYLMDTYGILFLLNIFLASYVGLALGYWKKDKF